MEIQAPPEGLQPDVIEYLFRQFKIVEDAINDTNGVAIRSELPERPRAGKLYFVDGKLYFWADDAWQTLAVESAGPLNATWETV